MFLTIVLAYFVGRLLYDIFGTIFEEVVDRIIVPKVYREQNRFRTDGEQK